jgi:hypothetical protein
MLRTYQRPFAPHHVERRLQSAHTTASQAPVEAVLDKGSTSRKASEDQLYLQSAFELVLRSGQAGMTASEDLQSMSAAVLRLGPALKPASWDLYT